MPAKTQPAPPEPAPASTSAVLLAHPGDPEGFPLRMPDAADEGRKAGPRSLRQCGPAGMERHPERCIVQRQRAVELVLQQAVQLQVAPAGLRRL